MALCQYRSSRSSSSRRHRSPGASFQSRGPTGANILHQWSPASPPSGSRWPPRAASAWGSQGNNELPLRCDHPGLPPRVRCLCERGSSAGTGAFLLHQPWLWSLKRVLEGHKYASLQEEVNLRAVAVLPLPARFRGIRASGRYGEGGTGRVQTFSLCFEIQRSKDSFTN